MASLRALKFVFNKTIAIPNFKWNASPSRLNSFPKKENFIAVV